MFIIKNFDAHTEQTNLALDNVRLFLVFSLSFFFFHHQRSHVCHAPLVMLFCREGKAFDAPIES